MTNYNAWYCCWQELVKEQRKMLLENVIYFACKFHKEEVEDYFLEFQQITLEFHLKIHYMMHHSQYDVDMSLVYV